MLIYTVRGLDLQLWELWKVGGGTGVTAFREGFAALHTPLDVMMYFNETKCLLVYGNNRC
jgi:hypothetical protein